MSAAGAGCARVSRFPHELSIDPRQARSAYDIAGRKIVAAQLASMPMARLKETTEGRVSAWLSNGARNDGFLRRAALACDGFQHPRKPARSRPSASTVARSSSPQPTELPASAPPPRPAHTAARGRLGRDQDRCARTSESKRAESNVTVIGRRSTAGR